MIELNDWPTGRSTRNSVLTRFGHDQADLVQWALTTGDVLADAVVLEARELGMAKARSLLNKGIREGIAALDDPPPAIRALLTETERRPDDVDDQLLDEGSLPYYTSPLPVHIISLSAGALVRVYESPSIAKVLTTTGRLVDGAERRIRETGTWLSQVMLPGGLQVGEQGYVATLEVRMLHAQMRRLALERGFDASVHGFPINQVDLGRTWTDFTLTSYLAEELLGFGMTEAEIASMYRYWRYVGRLLGIDARLVREIDSHDPARQLDEIFQAVTGPVGEDSAKLTEASLSSIAAMLDSMYKVPRLLGRPALNAITRRIHGPEMSRLLRVPRAPISAALLGAATSVLAAVRQRRRKNRQYWRTMIDKNIAVGRSLLENSTSGPTAYHRGATGAHD